MEDELAAHHGAVRDLKAHVLVLLSGGSLCILLHIMKHNLQPIRYPPVEPLRSAGVNDGQRKDGYLLPTTSRAALFRSLLRDISLRFR